MGLVLRLLFNAKTLLTTRPAKLVITESIIDSLSFIENEIPNVMPIYGTNGFTNEHLAFINELQPKEIVLALDNDETGNKAAGDLKDLFKNFSFNCNCQIVSFPDNQDANEYFLNHSKANFESLLKSPLKEKQEQEQEQTPTFQYKLVPLEKEGIIPAVLQKETLLKKYTIKYAELKNGRLNVTIHSVNPKTNRFLLDTVNLYSAKQRQNLILSVSNLFNQNQAEVETEINELILIAEAKVRDFKENGCKDSTTDESTVSLSAEEKQIALDFLKSPDLLNQIVKDYESIGYIGEEINKKNRISGYDFSKND